MVRVPILVLAGTACSREVMVVVVVVVTVVGRVGMKGSGASRAADEAGGCFVYHVEEDEDGDAAETEEDLVVAAEGVWIMRG